MDSLTVMGILFLAAIALVIIVAISARRPTPSTRQVLDAKERKRELRAKGQASAHPVIWSAVSVAIATLLLYGLSIGIAIDAADDVVITSLSGTDRINIVLGLYFVVLGLAFEAAVVATFRSARGIIIALVSLWAGGLTMLVLEWAIVIATVPRFPLTWDALLLVPAIFTYLATPSGFLVVQAALFIVFLAIASKRSGVD